MKKLITAILILCGVAGSAMAAGGAEQHAELPKQGDPAAGEGKVAVCTACHGQGGVSTSPQFPKLAGQHESYLYKQLVDVQSGDRVITTMTGLLNGMSEQDLLDIAAYYASQEQSYARVTGEDDTAINETIELGEQLFYGGNPETGVPACAACHSPTGMGNQMAGYPVLSGQHADYTAKQLYAYQAGYLQEDGSEVSEDARVNGPNEIMRDIAFNLKEHEIEALANYIQGLRPRQ